jgi:hypothetical protein
MVEPANIFYTTSAMMTVNVNKVAQPPVLTKFQIFVAKENIPRSTRIGLITATDADPTDKFRFKLLNGTQLFTVTSSGKLHR